ncbi:GM19063 [Drosophila sechellia]|uniref:GM19063 n=1 Tax=Drosophila sechellia TaxID=7238 RepID=B4I915_DROSE|nr:GM19063 [Drosophila sechellia]
MTSICSSKFQQQHYQLTNSNIFLLQHQHHHQTQQHQLIAPKIPLGTSQLQNMQHGQQSNIGPMLSSQKKKFNYNNMPYGEQLPSVARRNARERNRVKQVNNGFVNLRQHLPQTVVNSLSNGGRGTSKKLSKFLMRATQSAQSHSYHSASPTPSYSGSEISGGGYIKQELQEQDLKFDSFDSFSDEQPDDEELLDYISSWQEQ